MAVKIRLQRKGKKKKSIYRLVAAKSQIKRDGICIEILGNYDPRKSPISFEIKEERIKYWISVGAQPTDTVKRLLGEKGLIEKTEKNSRNKKISKKSLKEQQANKEG